jgi:diguanylate cyclase (GGDEF)-like protein
MAERIRNAICGTPVAFEGQTLASSVSIGVACFPDDGRTLDSLAARADRALYQAKQRGRNCVVRFRPSD